MDSLTSVILKMSGKRAKKEHTGKKHYRLPRYPSKDSLEHKHTAWAKHGQAAE